MYNIYEKHKNDYFISSELPFICHSDTIENRNLPDREIHGLHWHENPEFLRCTSGNGNVISSADKFGFKSDVLVNIPPNSPHSVFNEGSGKLCYECMIIDIDFCRQNGIKTDMLRFRANITDPEALRLFDRAFAACNDNKSPLYVARARIYVLDFLLYLCSEHSAGADSVLTVASADDIKKTVIYIRDNYAEQISLSDAAKIAGFSNYYFSHDIKRITGQSFITFLNTVRCENAAVMIKNGASVTKACFASGFKDISYFSRIFKKYMGVAPSSVRKNAKSVL